MRLTPYYRTFTIGIGGAPVEIDVYGRYICLISITPATMTLSIDDEAPNLMISGTRIDMESKPYRKLTFRNVGGAASTAIILISNVLVHDMRGDALIAAMVASLAAIDLDTNNLATIDIDTGAIAAAVAIPADGEAGQVALAAGGDGNPGNHVCRAIMFWTAEAQVYLRVNAALNAAANTHFLMNAGMVYTIQISNAQMCRFHNQDAGAAATVHYQYLT